jgi:hypothetical protein
MYGAGRAGKTTATLRTTRKVSRKPYVTICNYPRPYMTIHQPFCHTGHRFPANFAH